MPDTPAFAPRAFTEDWPSIAEMRAIMSDDTEIPPALTPEEWKRAISINEASDRYTPQAAMAVANDVLPDDSPYKITRTDVQMLRDEASFAVFPDRPRHMRALAAKLESLLPPETP